MLKSAPEGRPALTSPRASRDEKYRSGLRGVNAAGAHRGTKEIQKRRDGPEPRDPVLFPDGLRGALVHGS